MLISNKLRQWDKVIGDTVVVVIFFTYLKLPVWFTFVFPVKLMKTTERMTNETYKRQQNRRKIPEFDKCFIA